MGVLTTAYAADQKLLSYIARGIATLETVISTRPDGVTVWRETPWFQFDPERPVDVFRFDKGFEDLMRVFEYVGLRGAATKFQTGKSISPRNDETAYREGWIVLPAAVKGLSSALEQKTFEELVGKWNAARTKELKKSGLDIGSLDDLVLPDFESLKGFLNKAAAEGSQILMLVQ